MMNVLKKLFGKTELRFNNVTKEFTLKNGTTDMHEAMHQFEAHVHNSIDRLVAKRCKQWYARYKAINENQLARAVSKLEGKKQSLSIAQIKEVQHILLNQLANFPLHAVDELLAKKRQESFSVAIKETEAALRKQVASTLKKRR